VPESCPICGKPTNGPAQKPGLRPFCSARCADVDLGRWFTGSYTIPAPPPDMDDDDGVEPP
jgi:endogenous inhibitor of DNA gyrase (YacG/DUF329 family)